MWIDATVPSRASHRRRWYGAGTCRVVAKKSPAEAGLSSSIDQSGSLVLAPTQEAKPSETAGEERERPGFRHGIGRGDADVIDAHLIVVGIIHLAEAQVVIARREIREIEGLKGPGVAGAIGRRHRRIFVKILDNPRSCIKRVRDAPAHNIDAIALIFDRDSEIQRSRAVRARGGHRTGTVVLIIREEIVAQRHRSCAGRNRERLQQDVGRWIPLVGERVEISTCRPGGSETADGRRCRIVDEPATTSTRFINFVPPRKIARLEAAVDEEFRRCCWARRHRRQHRNCGKCALNHHGSHFLVLAPTLLSLHTAKQLMCRGEISRDISALGNYEISPVRFFDICDAKEKPRL